MLDPIKNGRGWRFCSFAKFHVLLLMLGGLMALFFLVEAIRFLPVKGENIYAEAQGVAIALRWSKGVPLYADFRHPPYVMTTFTPLWYGALAVAAKLGLGNMDSLTLFGRLLSLASALGLGFLGYLCNRRLGVSKGLSLLMPLFFLSFPIMIPWVPLARPDLPALFFCLLSVYIVLGQPRAIWVTLAGVSGTVAFLIKHDSIAVPGAIVLWMLLARRWKHALLYSLVWWVPVVATYAWFNHSSPGMMHLNLAPAHFGNPALGYFHELWITVMAGFGHEFAIALLAFALLGFVFSVADPRARLLAIYFVLVGGLLVSTTALSNGGDNHYLEAALVWSLLTPMGLAGLRRSWPEASSLSFFAALFVFLFLCQALDLQRWRAFKETPPDNHRLVSLLSNRPVFSDLPYLAARNSTLELLEPTALMYQEKGGGWTSEPIIQDIRRYRYDLVILHRELGDPAWKTVRNPTLSPSLRAAIQKNYKFCFELDSAFVYAPASMPADGTSQDTCPASPVSASDRREAPALH